MRLVPPAAPKSSLPPGCSTADADNILADFLVNPIVAPPGFFTTVSITDPDGRRFVTHSGPAAVKHLQARIKAGEDDRMISLAVAPIDFNHVAVAFRLTRYAPDYDAAPHPEQARPGHGHARLRPRQGRLLHRHARSPADSRSRSILGNYLSAQPFQRAVVAQSNI